MSVQLHLARPDDGEKLLAMMARFHEEFGLDLSDDHRARTLAPVLEGSPLAAAYLIGPRRAPVGYITVSFGWAMELGGIDGFIDEFFIRPSVRGRGIGQEALARLLPALAEAGVQYIHLEADREDSKAHRLYQRAGFKLRERYLLMSMKLSR